VSHDDKQSPEKWPSQGGTELDPHYLAFFDCFNAQRFFEAHEVLEELWLVDRGSDRAFYQGLIQLAGAFVHFQKNRFKPAASLLKLAAEKLEKYPSPHLRFSVQGTLRCIATWLREMERTSYTSHPFSQIAYPTLSLLGDVQASAAR